MPKDENKVKEATPPYNNSSPDDSDKSKNIIKEACIELGVTQKELAKLLGVNEGTPAQWSSKGIVPDIAIKAIENLKEIRKLKRKLRQAIIALNTIDQLKKEDLTKYDD